MRRLGAWALCVLGVVQGSCATEGEPAPEGPSSVGAVQQTLEGGQGVSCSNDADCVSGHCADGVCCDMACGDTDLADCQACSVAAGAALDGICALVSGGTVCRPAAGECDEPEVCTGDFELCPGDRRKPTTELCHDTTCDPTANEMTLPTYCNGASVVCPEPATTDCGPFGCAATGCAFRCAGDSICSPGNYCPYVEYCYPQQGNGTECWKEAQCLSGHCIDGVCCDTDCGSSDPDDCQSCAQVSNLGTCSVAEAGAACRPVSRACDLAEVCTGSSSVCPSDLRAPDGTPCFRGVCESAACEAALSDGGPDAADAARDASLVDAARDASSADARDASSIDAAPKADAQETGTFPPGPDTGAPDAPGPRPDAGGSGGADGGTSAGNGGAAPSTGGAPSDAGTGAGGAAPGSGGDSSGAGGDGSGGALSGAGGDGSGGALAGAGGDGSGGAGAGGDGSGGAGAGGDGSGGAGAGGAGAGGDGSGGAGSGGDGSGGAAAGGAASGGAGSGGAPSGSGGAGFGGTRSTGGTGAGGTPPIGGAGGARATGGTSSAGSGALSDGGLPDGSAQDGKSGDEGSCGCRVVARRTGGGAEGLGLLLLAGVLRRRRSPARGA